MLKVHKSFSVVEWSKAESRADMNILWEKWLQIYNCLVEELIGTRWARISSWGRKFNYKVRELCIEASIARSWFVEAKRAGGDLDEFFTTWKRSRQRFIRAWQQANRDWYIECVKRAIGNGEGAVWRLLSDKWKKTSRSMAVGKDTILTDPKMIESELLSFHNNSRKENSSVSPGDYQPVVWDHPFSESDNVLELSDDMVIR